MITIKPLPLREKKEIKNHWGSFFFQEKEKFMTSATAYN